jgi:RNA polymerase sigma-70 factor (ECF subfamily)
MTTSVWRLAEIVAEDGGGKGRLFPRDAGRLASHAADHDADRALVERLRAGDWDAMRTVFETHYAALTRIATRLAGSAAASEDVVQEVLLRIWANRGNLRPASTLRAYLVRAVRNRVLNDVAHEHVARRLSIMTHDVPPGMAAPVSSPVAEMEKDELESRLRLAIAALPPRQREAMLFRWRDDMSPAEVAEAMGTSERVARKQLLAAATKLRSVFGLDR